MGQVQGKKKKKARKQKRALAHKDSIGEKKKILLWIQKGSDEGRKHRVLEEKAVEAPSLNTMRARHKVLASIQNKLGSGVLNNSQSV